MPVLTFIGAVLVCGVLALGSWYLGSKFFDYIEDKTGERDGLSK